jgi:hypothetical protein
LLQLLYLLARIPAQRLARACQSTLLAILGIAIAGRIGHFLAHVSAVFGAPVPAHSLLVVDVRRDVQPDDDVAWAVPDPVQIDVARRADMNKARICIPAPPGPEIASPIGAPRPPKNRVPRAITCMDMQE